MLRTLLAHYRFLTQSLSFGAVFLTPIAIWADDNWNRFRGPNGTGVGSKLEFSGGLTEDLIVWKQAIPAGNSSPVIVDGRIYLTSFSAKKQDQEGKRTIHCFDSKSGDSVWSLDYVNERTEPATPPNSPATSSVACDGKTVVAFFADTGLIACNVKGEKMWARDLGPHSSMHGLCSSPIIHNQKVILSIDQLSDPYILAVDLETGKDVWKVDRLPGVTGGYSTPALIELDKKTYVVSAAPGEMVVYDVDSGEKKGSVEGLSNAPVSAPIVIENRVFYNETPGSLLPMSALGNIDANGNGAFDYSEVEKIPQYLRLMKRIDTGFGNSDEKVTQEEWDKAFGTFVNRGGFSCVAWKANADTVQGEVIWNFQKTVPYVSSSIVLNEIAYFINDPGIILSFDLGTGKLLQRERLSKASGTYYASPVAAGNQLIFASLDGKITVVEASDKLHPSEPYALDESIAATPSIYQGRLFVRSESFLYCFGKKG